MGLLPAEQRVDTLNLATVRTALRHIRRAGIGTSLGLALHTESEPELGALERSLADLNLALEESPAPAHEWGRVTAVVGIELLSRLVGISPISARRYAKGQRTTPDAIAARLHFLALVIADLAGAYNDAGIRQWFDRRRAQLDGRAPGDLLRGHWAPDAAGARRVRALARSLLGASAT